MARRRIEEAGRAVGKREIPLKVAECFERLPRFRIDAEAFGFQPFAAAFHLAADQGAEEAGAHREIGGPGGAAMGGRGAAGGAGARARAARGGEARGPARGGGAAARLVRSWASRALSWSWGEPARSRVS